MVASHTPYTQHILNNILRRKAVKQPLLGSDELAVCIEELNEGLAIPWEIVDQKLYKVFDFLNFTHAFAFMTQVAFAAEKMDHHPEWSNVYRTVEVYLTTHNSGGITALDFELAQHMEGIISRGRS